MSEPLKILIYCAGHLAIAAPFLMYALRNASRHSDEWLAKVAPSSESAIGSRAHEWLREQARRRMRWSIIATAIAFCAVLAVGILFRDARLMREGWAMIQFPIAWLLGLTIGGSLACVHAASSRSETRRVASLRPRTLTAYTRWWERGLHLAHVALAGASIIVVTVLGLTGTLDARISWPLLGLAVAWLLVLGILNVMQRRVMRDPPHVADDNLHLARELMVSIAVRELLTLEHMLVVIVSYFALVHLALTIGFSTLVGVVPIYAVVIPVAIIRALRGGIRADRGIPGPEWYFARTEAGRAA